MEKAIGSENSGGAGFRASGGAASAADLKNDNNNSGSALTKDQRIEKVKYLRSQVLMHFTSDSLMLRCAILFTMNLTALVLDVVVSFNRVAS